MKSDSQAPADLIPLLRQQILLAQVRIMELEDARDEQAPRLVETAALLAAAQQLAEQQSDAAAHAEKVRGALQAEFDHLRHVQHVTNEALNTARADSAGHLARNAGLLAEIEKLHQLVHQLTEAERQHLSRQATLETELARARSESADRATRIEHLDAEQRALKASRSWRWTAWLRGIERLFK